MINTSVSLSENEKPSSIRPENLSTYIGQTHIKENLAIAIEAAKKRDEPLDHVLLYGPPGLGKTTLSMIIANEMNAHIHITSGPAIEKPGDIVAILNSLSEHDVLFIDEIHRLPKTVEEVLYSAMEDYMVSITVGSGPQMRVISLDLPKFTLIGATTRAGMLSAPLRDRFGHLFKMQYYDIKELMQIISNTANKLNVNLSNDMCETIAKASRGTPRIANNTLKRARDYIEIVAQDEKASGEDFLQFMNMHQNGLTQMDIDYLHTIGIIFQNKPTGIHTIAAAMGEDVETLETVCEPYLIQQGYILKTPKGRILTELYLQELHYES